MNLSRLLPPKHSLIYPLRTTVAAVLALVIAELVGLREVYWAPISALVVVQSSFGASLLMSWHRLAGTAVGASVGALLAATGQRSLLVYACGLVGIGLLSAALRFDRPANRFAAITFTIVLLIVRPDPAWVIALHRFIEVSTGIVAGLVLSAVWPERLADQPAAQG
jgi:uncharacterized membrane protein YccC